MRFLVAALSCFALILATIDLPALAADQQQPEKRIAFVVGNESYAAGALPTAANDAGLVAQTLQAAGFEVVGARDLDAETLRQSYADFLKRVTDAGPNTVAFVYLAGYGLQYGNANFYVPIGANVSRDSDIPIETIRLSDLTGPLIALNLKARFMVFDTAYKLPFQIAGAPLAGGLSIIDAAPGSLIAYNAAPTTVAAPAKGNYGLYAQSLAAMLREGGLPPDEIFDRVRLRVSDQSKGAEVPWDASKIDTAFRFFERQKNAPPPAASPEQVAALTTKPLKDLPVREAYTAAVARDTIDSYSEFCTAYRADPLAKRARILLAARREALTWHRTIVVDTPPAYWSYLARYPKGPHAYDARLRLQELAAAFAPPPDFQAIVYDVPPPPPEEIVYIDRPVVFFDDPAYDLPPPPPPPEYWLPPVPVAFIDLPPPPPPIGLFYLPVPAFVPLPAYYDPPPFVAYPSDNYFFAGAAAAGAVIATAAIVSNIHQSFPGGGPRDLAGRGGVAPGGRAIGQGVALPAAALTRTNALADRGITTPTQLRAARGTAGGLRNAPGPRGAAERNALPGANGRPLPNAGRAGENGRPGEARRGGTEPAARNAAGRTGGETGRPGAERNQAAERQDRSRETRQNAQRAAGGRQGPAARAERGGRPGREGAARAARGDGRRGFAGQTGPRARQGAGPRGPASRAAGPRIGAQQERGPARQGGFGGPRQGGFAGPRPGGFAGPRPGGFGGAGGFPGGRPGGQPAFGGGRPGGAPGGFAGPRPGGGRPGGFPGGGGGPRPGGGGGGPRPGGGHPGGPGPR